MTVGSDRVAVENNYMRRREFITIVGAAAAAGWPFAARAQRTGKMYRIGILVPNTPAIVARSPRIRAFLQGLQDLGWIDGQNVTLEWRYGDGQSERLVALAADLANIKVDIIVTAAATAASAAKQATSTIPVVILDPGDPVGTGLVQSRTDVEFAAAVGCGSGFSGLGGGTCGDHDRTSRGSPRLS
jgi:putative tryptophan/tyrosine transport system substrate-binding protein